MKGAVCSWRKGNRDDLGGAITTVLKSGESNNSQNGTELWAVTGGNVRDVWTSVSNF